MRLCPAAAKAVLASHVSAEPAGMLLLDALRKKPLITEGMRLGEGTGAVAAMPLLDMARAVYMDCLLYTSAPVAKCSNFIGDALDEAAALGFADVLLVGHIGKLAKLAGSENAPFPSAGSKWPAD